MRPLAVEKGFRGITTTQTVIWNRKKETKLQIGRLQWHGFFFPLKKKPVSSTYRHSSSTCTPMDWNLVADGGSSSFATGWRQSTLLTKRYKQKTKTQKLAARIHIRRGEACMHTNTHIVIMQTPHIKRQQNCLLRSGRICNTDSECLKVLNGGGGKKKEN